MRGVLHLSDAEIEQTRCFLTYETSTHSPRTHQPKDTQKSANIADRDLGYSLKLGKIN
jgi:hypothetical protein